MKIILISMLLLLIIWGCSETATQDKPKPNIVFIMADDLGWADLSCYGNRFNESPNIDQLALEGVRFTNSYAAGAVCSPTRASIMSGQYPARVGIIDFIPGLWRTYEKMTPPVNRTQYLPDEITTIAELLKENGYTNGYFGKWHLGFLSEQHPLNQGFDVARIAQGKFYDIAFEPEDTVEMTGRFSEKLTKYGIDFIEKNQNKPFFLFLSHYDVHINLDADQEFIDKYLKKGIAEGYPCNAIYAAMIEHLDRSVGQISNKIKELGLEDNTILIFCSDNGGLNMRYDKGPLVVDSKKELYRGDSLLYIASSNLPLRGEKGNLYEGGIRIPLIVKWPQKIEGGKESAVPVTSVDYFPTLAEAAGCDLPGEQILDGVNIFSPPVSNQTNTDRAIYWHYPVYHHGVPASAVRLGDWKLIEFLDDDHVELYNLASDLGEREDLSKINSEKTRELRKMLNQWRGSVSADMPLPNPAFDSLRRNEWGIHPHLFNMVKYKIRKGKWIEKRVFR